MPTSCLSRAWWGAAWPGVMVLSWLLVACGLAAEPAAQQTPVTAARRLLQEGKYAEAEEAFAALPADQAEAAVLGQARCQEATGHGANAVRLLTDGTKAHPKSAALPAELARLELQRGNLSAAETWAAQARQLSPEQAQSRWVQAEVLKRRGQLDEAATIYRALVDDYNDRAITDVEQLRWIGLAAGEHARWQRLSDQFKFLVNEFYPDLLVADPTFWQAHWAAGRLFAEKYNDEDATKSFKAALALNPHAAELHVALGRLAVDGFEIEAAENSVNRALEINPELLEAWHLKADIHLTNIEPRQAVGVLSDALKLDPHNEETLGRLAAAVWSVEGDKPDGRFGKLVAEVNSRNPHAGQFFTTLADTLDRLRRWPASAKYYREATQRMPQLIAPIGQLGMILMRLGEEEQAKQILDQAFAADPFNVRVNNTLQVLDVLAGYETLETPHFVIRFDPAHDRVVARYMAQWLEQVYPRLVRQMGFAPPEKSLFEVFSKAKNTDGHGWFSARLVGLPRIHPIGACAGKIVALQSPGEGDRGFNWARVLQHEFVHVINLQQTDFNIPHWFTEALAVWTEGYPRPADWNAVLVERSARGTLFNLDTINLGFIRPQSSADWTLAYCQAELYAEYMLKQHGDQAVARMLAAYADNLTTPEALSRALGVEQAEFERGYREYVANIVAALPASTAREPDLADLQKLITAQPKDPQVLAQWAQAQLGRRNYAEARRASDAALAADEKNGLAHYVRARLHLLVGENQQALAQLNLGLDRDHPQENLLGLLAGLKLKAEDYPGAAELYELGTRHDPANPKWLKSLSAVYLKSKDSTKLAATLAQLAEADPDDFLIRKKLAALAWDRADAVSAARWALEAMHINVLDVDVHRIRAEALAAHGDTPEAAQEYSIAIELAPEELSLRMALAQTFVKAAQPLEAQHTLQELLKRDAKYPGAAELLESLK